MASRIKAINAYRPKIDLQPRVEMDDVVAFIARSTGLNESGVRQVLLELRDTIIFFTATGHPVKLEGLGTYTPSINVEGEVNLGYRVDSVLLSKLNEQFHGEIINKENIGKSTEELIAMWNEAHPDDPVS